MVYAFYDKKTEKLTVVTNLMAIVELSGVKYHTLRYWFRNGTDEKKTEDFIIWKTAIVKGNQKVTKKKGQSSDRPNPEPKDSGDLFDEILNKNV